MSWKDGTIEARRTNAPDLWRPLGVPCRLARLRLFPRGLAPGRRGDAGEIAAALALAAKPLGGRSHPKESIAPARQEAQGSCTGSWQARLQPRYRPAGLSDSSVSHKSMSRNARRGRNRCGCYWPRSALPTVARDIGNGRAIETWARPGPVKTCSVARNFCIPFSFRSLGGGIGGCTPV